MNKANAKPPKLPDPVKRPVSHAIAKRKLAPKFTEADIDAVARLIATRKMTQIEACSVLNINYGSFKSWMSAHAMNEKYSDCITRARAASLDRAIASIEESAYEGDAKGRKDWRAGAWLASRVLVDDGRFDERKAEQANGPSVDIAGLLQAAAKVYCPPPPEPKALPEITVAELPAPKTDPQV